MTSNVCRQCSADTSVIHLDRVEGEENGVRAALEGLPALTCANGHRRFPSPEFPLDFIQHLLASEVFKGMAHAVEKGLFRKRLYCPSCGHELSGESAGLSNGQTRVEVPHGEPVSVEIQVPLHRCPGCEQEASAPKSGLERDVMQAVANAFRGADIQPG